MKHQQVNIGFHVSPTTYRQYIYDDEPGVHIFKIYILLYVQGLLYIEVDGIFFVHVI